MKCALMLYAILFMQGYGVEFKDYKKFGDKHGARLRERP
jgi:hypothetical protein